MICGKRATHIIIRWEDDGPTERMLPPATVCEEHKRLFEESHQESIAACKVEFMELDVNLGRECVVEIVNA